MTRRSIKTTGGLRSENAGQFRIRRSCGIYGGFPTGKIWRLFLGSVQSDGSLKSRVAKTAILLPALLEPNEY